jgi:hypothetical protein
MSVPRLLVALAWMSVAACMSAPPDGDDAAWAASVATRNEDADRLIDRGDIAGARRVLAAIVASDPGPAAAGEARRMLLQDTYFRLARLELDAREPAAAVGHARQGLALGGAEDDLFVANLLVARGAGHEALGETAAALADYDRAMRINETLLRRTLSPP